MVNKDNKHLEIVRHNLTLIREKEYNFRLVAKTIHHALKYLKSIKYKKGYRNPKRSRITEARVEYRKYESHKQRAIFLRLVAENDITDGYFAISSSIDETRSAENICKTIQQLIDEVPEFLRKGDGILYVR